MPNNCSGLREVSTSTRPAFTNSSAETCEINYRQSQFSDLPVVQSELQQSDSVALSIREPDRVPTSRALIGVTRHLYPNLAYQLIKLLLLILFSLRSAIRCSSRSKISKHGNALLLKLSYLLLSQHHWRCLDWLFFHRSQSPYAQHIWPWTLSIVNLDLLLADSASRLCQGTFLE